MNSLVQRPRAPFKACTKRNTCTRSCASVVRTRAMRSAIPSFDAPPVGHVWRQKARKQVLESFSEGVLYLKGGKQQTRNGSDGLSPFRQEANFMYMTGVPFPEYECLLDADSGMFTLFVPDLPEGMDVWVGAQPTFDEIAELYGADEVLSTRHLAMALSAMDSEKVFTLPKVDNEALNKYEVDTSVLQSVLGECRAVKFHEEISCLKYANEISGAAHEAMWVACKPSSYEYELEAVFMQHTMAAGLRHQGYPAIVGSGTNSATLHYEHNDKQVLDGDLVLVDAGAEYSGYTADITRTFPANGKFTGPQRELYEAVLLIQETSLDNFRAGLKWETVTWDARRVACQCLLDLGVVKGSVDSLMENEISRLFMPHGLGHHLGLQVHDHGPNGPLPGLLKEGNVVTCEPGLYFIDSILRPAVADATKKEFINVDALSTFNAIGGVRIEDDVVITSDGINNLTTAAKQISDVETIMQSY